MGFFSSLKREQKEAVGLLQLGTFLEYFDLMLYVHMAVFLNDVFFPKTDPHTGSLLTAFALCSSLAFRPIGALIFGWIGDRIGRKSTIVITTAMMSIPCIVMANLPTYAQMGISAAWIVTLCRILQGMSSMGEVVGGEIYLTETIARPARFPLVICLYLGYEIGSITALGVSFLVLSCNMNWRLAFWAGAAIAVVSAFARRRLRETPVFLDLKRKQLKKDVEQVNLESDPIQGEKFNQSWKERLNYKTLLSYFFISCGGPLRFYLGFFHFIPLLKGQFGYTSEGIIMHNFFLACVSFLSASILAFLSYHIHPLRIQRVRTCLALLLILALPFLVASAATPVQLFCIQSLILLFSLEEAPSVPIFWFHFPVYCRFRCATLLFSFARALMYIVTSFGMVYLTSWLGSFGVWAIALPIALAYLYAISHFQRLEQQYKLYPNVY